MMGLRTIALWVLIGTLTLSAAAQTPQEVFLERTKDAIDDLWERVDVNPGDEAQWETLARMVAQRRAALTAMGKAEETGDRPTTAEGVYREWIRLSPQDHRPYLVLAMLPGDTSRRGSVLSEAWQRFPERSEVAKAWASYLSSGGDDQAATEVLEGMLERFPEDRDAWRFAVNHHRQQGNDVMVESLVQEWLTAIPGDGLGLATWLDLHLRRADKAQAREFAVEASTRMRVDQDGIVLCDRLLLIRGGELQDLATSCFEKVRQETADSTIKERTERELRKIQVSGTPGASRVQALVDEDPSSKGLITTAMKLAQRQQCGDAVAVLDHLESFAEEHTKVASGVSRALLHCWKEESAQGFMLRVLERAPAADLSLVLGKWVEALPEVEVDSRLRQRLDQEENPVPVHQALDLLYRSTSDPAAREANLRAWIETDSAYRRDKKYEILADLLVQQGRVEESAKIVRAGIENHSVPSWSLTERLIRIDLDAGESDRAIEEARSFITGSKPKYHHWAYRFLAQYEASRENLVQSEEYAWAYFEVEGSSPEMETLLVALLCRRDDLTKATEFLAERHELKSRRQPLGSVEQYTAERLAGAGQFEAALDYLVKALERAPERADLYRKIGALTAAMGFEAEATEVFDELIRLQPRSFESWFRLAVYHYARGDYDRSAEVIEASREYLGEDSRPDRFLVEIRLAQGQLEEALGILEDLVKEHPDDEGLRKELEWLTRSPESSPSN